MKDEKQEQQVQQMPEAVEQFQDEAVQEKKPETKPVAKPDVPAAKPAPAPKKAALKSGGKMAVVLVRNLTRASGVVKDTLRMLGLQKKFTCAVVEKNETMLGMLNKVKDYTTYGEIDEATLNLLQEKRGRKDAEGKLRRDFHLHPPRGGFERKGIKHSFTQGGVVGYRREKMNKLINKML
jgi:large subunit ribosomal protein L30